MTEKKTGLFYVIEDGKYKLIHPSRGPVLVTPEVAVCYLESPAGVVTMQHGSPDAVRDWMEHSNKTARLMGGDLRVVSGKIPVDELNKLIDNSTYLPYFLCSNFPDTYAGLLSPCVHRLSQ